MMTEVLQEARAMILDFTHMVTNINWMNWEKEPYIVKSFIPFFYLPYIFLLFSVRLSTFWFTLLNWWNK